LAGTVTAESGVSGDLKLTKKLVGAVTSETATSGVLAVYGPTDIYGQVVAATSVVAGILRGYDGITFVSVADAITNSMTVTDSITDTVSVGDALVGSASIAETGDP
jgi:hypothetical protein